MKKLFSILLAVTLLCACVPAALAAKASDVTLSTSNLPALPGAPDAPKIVRCIQSGSTMTIRFDRELPKEHALSLLALDSELHTTSVRYAAADGEFRSEALPAGGAWLRIELDWVGGGDNASAVYNASGGLVSRIAYDADYNGYVYDQNGALTEFRSERSGVWVRFTSTGKTYSYSYEKYGMRVWFDMAGNVLSATYDGSGYECVWDPELSWHVKTPTGAVKVNVALSPMEAEPLLITDVEPTPTIEVTWYPNNTVNLAGLSLQEASTKLPDKWYNVIPVDLTHNGRQTYFLTVSNARFIGECYVDVWDGEVTVTCEIMDRSGIEVLSEYGRWFTSLSQISLDSLESSRNGFEFGVPVDIAEDLGGADVALLYIRSKATYRQPFRDGTELTRYWRNTPEWKQFRKDLTTLMPYVD